MNNIQIDSELMLQPISGEYPEGINTEYDAIYREIRDAMRSSPDIPVLKEGSLSDPSRADWRKVKRLCEQVLQQTSKDLQLACWYVESLGHLYGPEGLEKGFQFLAKFITLFWNNSWPSLEEGLDFRYSKLIRLDKEISHLLSEYSLFESRDLSLSIWYKVLSVEEKNNKNTEEKYDIQRADNELSVERFYKNINNQPQLNLNNELSRFLSLPAVLDELESCYFFQSHDDVHEIFSKTRKNIADITELLSKFIVKVPIGHDFSEDVLFTSLSPVHERNFNVETMTRDIAISQLEAISKFYRESEPTSPVPYLLERAIRWSRMSMTEWLEELLTDKESVEQINRILKGKK